MYVRVESSLTCIREGKEVKGQELGRKWSLGEGKWNLRAGVHGEVRGLQQIDGAWMKQEGGKIRLWWEREKTGKGRSLIWRNNVFAGVQHSHESSDTVLWNQRVSHCIIRTHTRLYKGNKYHDIAQWCWAEKGLRTRHKRWFRHFSTPTRIKTVKTALVTFFMSNWTESTHSHTQSTTSRELCETELHKLIPSRWDMPHF